MPQIVLEIIWEHSDKRKHKVEYVNPWNRFFVKLVKKNLLLLKYVKILRNNFKILK